MFLLNAENRNTKYTILPKVLGHPLLMKGLTNIVFQLTFVENTFKNDLINGQTQH